MADHDGCRDVLRRSLARACGRAGLPGIDATISAAPPLVSAPPGHWQPMGYTCPHGTTYWIEPTGEQRARWRAEGVVL
jgi:hypothetical protein